MSNPTDEDLNARLAEAYGFTPWDGFAHCREQLRKGRVNYVIRHGKETSYKDRCGFIDPSGTTQAAFVDSPNSGKAYSDRRKPTA